MVLADRVAFVTGGAKRIGREIALTLAGRGCHVAINYKTSAADAKKTLEDLHACKVKAVALQGDISKKTDIVRMIKEIEEKLGPIDFLINNASVFKKSKFPDISEKEWDENIGVHMTGPFLLAQILGPKMAKRNGGKIINLVDYAGEHPFRSYIPYSVSKAGLICLTKALAKVLAPKVQVNAIAPGPILWPENAAKKEMENLLKKIPLRRFGSPKDICSAILFLLEGTDFATGSVLNIDGGLII